MFATYTEAFNAAQAMADKNRVDYGIESVIVDGTQSYNVHKLPRFENRYGHELRCEVIRPSLPPCAPFPYGD